mgnify:FL=1
MHSIKDMYKAYKKDNPNSDTTYALYTYIIEKFNKSVIEEVLKGKTFYMGHNMGSLRIKKVNRNFKKPTIDWGETNKLKKEGINKHVYYTDDVWYRWYWDKYRAKVSNKTVYRFDPMKGPTGSKKQLVKHLKNDEFAHLNYKE